MDTSPKNSDVLEEVRSQALVARTYGSPRIHAVLKAKGLRVSRKRIIRRMKGLGVRGRKRRAFVRTTDSVGGAAWTG